jgi:hypothetical protein
LQLRALLDQEDKAKAAALEDEGVFGLRHIREKIEAAVQEAAELPEACVAPQACHVNTSPASLPCERKPRKPAM